MSDLCLSKYENYFLLHIIKNNEIWADYLIDQLNNSSIFSKEYTGAGVYIDFEIDEKNTFLKKADVPLFFEADAIAPDRSDAVFFYYIQKNQPIKKAESSISWKLQLPEQTMTKKKSIHGWWQTMANTKHK